MSLHMEPTLRVVVGISSYCSFFEIRNSLSTALPQAPINSRVLSTSSFSKVLESSPSIIFMLVLTRLKCDSALESATSILSRAEGKTGKPHNTTLRN